MPDVTASYGTLLDFAAFLGIFINYWRPLMFKILYLYLHQNYVCNQYIRTNISICQM